MCLQREELFCFCFLPKGNIVQLNFLLLLTHPHFSKLAGTKFIHHLQSLSGNLPLILSPGSLRGAGFTGISQPLAQTIRRPYRCNAEVWEKSKNEESLTEMKPCSLALSEEKHKMCPNQNVEKKTCKQLYKKTQQNQNGGEGAEYELRPKLTYLSGG